MCVVNTPMATKIKPSAANLGETVVVLARNLVLETDQIYKNVNICSMGDVVLPAQ